MPIFIGDEKLKDVSSRERLDDKQSSGTYRITVLATQGVRLTMTAYCDAEIVPMLY